MDRAAADTQKLQKKILEIMKYIDGLCRENGITYYIMGGTALGAVRHGGFVPWDDDLDIFMTPGEYAKFKAVFQKRNSERFVLQEWRTTPDYLEYAKLRMNGTTFIEANFADNKEMHHGIYVDIMMLHKVPKRKITQRIVYYKSKYVTLYGISQRNWIPKNGWHKLALRTLKLLPNRALVRNCYKHIYRYEDLEDYCYCYWITKANFRQGLFEESFFREPVDIPFEDTALMASSRIRDYLSYRYGDYMTPPPPEQVKYEQHAMVWDTEKDYREYIP